MKNIIIIVLSVFSLSSYAQTDSITNPLKISGYVDVYYAYDFGNPSNHNRPVFMYAYNRHNEVNLHLGLIQISYETGKVKSNLALMVGTYANINLAAEPDVLKNIYEANAGVKISKTKNIWIDAGIFPSHIGFESAIGQNCWNLTRSIMAENSPYFETGAKISYTSDNEKWFVSGLILNGWQRIQRINGNNTPAFGHQLTFKPNSKITLNSSSFIGNDLPENDRAMRYFHDFYAQYQLHEKFGIVIGFDMEAQQKSKGSSNYNTWYSPVLIAKYSPANKLSIAARGEYYNDANGMIISSGTPNGFQTFGYSLNVDFNIMPNVMWRIEGRSFSSMDKIFRLDNRPSNQNYSVITSLTVSL